MKSEAVAAGIDVTCPDPVNLEEPDRFLFARGKIMSIPPQLLQTHDNVHVYGRGPLCCDGEYLSEWFVMPEQVAEYRRRRKHWRDGCERFFLPPRSFDQPALWVTDNWSCGYFHWTCDALPRLETVREHRSLSDVTLLLPTKASRCPFILESLQSYGLKAVRVLGRFEHLRCRELLLPTHVAPTGSYHPEVMRQLHQRFVRHTADHVSPGSSASCERLYISRSLAGRRRIANEQELLPILKELGFRIVHAERESWASQIQLAAQAKLLVSNHGAGLTNMIAMAPGSRVFEIRDYLNPQLYCYYTLAAAMRLNYYYMLAGRENAKAKPNWSNMLVNPVHFQAVVQRMIRDQQSSGQQAA